MVTKRDETELTRATLDVLKAVESQITASDFLEDHRLPSKTEKITILVFVTTNALKRKIILTTREFAKKQGSSLNISIVATSTLLQNVCIFSPASLRKRASTNSVGQQTSSSPHSFIHLPTDELVIRVMMSLKNYCALGWDSSSTKLIKDYNNLIVPLLNSHI